MRTFTNFITESDNTDYKTMYEEILNKCKEVSTAKSVRGSFGTFCPHLQFIRFDALEEKDYPNHINDNSIFLEFKIDLKAQKLELFRSGHVWLSPADKETDKYKYLAMKSMVNIAVDKGGKKFRKCGYKSVDDLVKKMESYFENIMKYVEDYTGGYPYKQGK